MAVGLQREECLRDLKNYLKIEYIRERIVKFEVENNTQHELF